MCTGWRVVEWNEREFIYLDIMRCGEYEAHVCRLVLRWAWRPVRVARGDQEWASVSTFVVRQPVRATQADPGLHNKRAACWTHMEEFTGMKERLNDHFSGKSTNGITLGIWAAGHTDYLFVWNVTRWWWRQPVGENLLAGFIGAAPWLGDMPPWILLRGSILSCVRHCYKMPTVCPVLYWALGTNTSKKQMLSSRQISPWNLRGDGANIRATSVQCGWKTEMYMIWCPPTQSPVLCDLRFSKSCISIQASHIRSCKLGWKLIFLHLL